MQVQPYLFFDGRCEEAIEFYKTAVGAKVAMLMRFNQSPLSATTPLGMGEKVMHGRLIIGKSTVLVSDGRCIGTPEFEGFSLSLVVASDAEADRFFNALADGGRVTMPLEKTFFSSKFGMLQDRFGVGWLIYVES
jgi:PhnB protein